MAGDFQALVLISRHTGKREGEKKIIKASESGVTNKMIQQNNFVSDSRLI